jgi:transmembrane sensor
MTPHEDQGDNMQGLAFGKLLRRAAADMAPPHWEKYGLDRLLRSVGAMPHSSVRHVRWRSVVLAAAAFALVAGGLWLVLARPAAKAVAFKVEGAELTNPNYVVALNESPAKMNFTDGSSVELMPAARVRIQQLTASGATMVLERGRAVTNVVHRSASKWKLLAGPFEINIVGTRFKTDWDPATESLTVDLYQGSLQIDGQRLGESAVLQKGQRFRAVGHKASWSISPIDDANDAASAASVASDVSQRKPESGAKVAAAVLSARAAVAAVAPARSTQSGWAAAMAKGEFSRVVSEAEARGVAMCLDQCSTSDVRLLADAARYTRHFELSEQALGALRRRAPGEAPAAAYLLGVLNESQGRSMAALRWYEQCVAEAPTSRVVSEAQAGRLRMLVATNQLDAAKAAARQYLADYPRGVGESTARKLLENR